MKFIKKHAILHIYFTVFIGIYLESFRLILRAFSYRFHALDAYYFSTTRGFHSILNGRLEVIMVKLKKAMVLRIDSVNYRKLKRS